MSCLEIESVTQYSPGSEIHYSKGKSSFPEGFTFKLKSEKESNQNKECNQIALFFWGGDVIPTLNGL